MAATRHSPDGFPPDGLAVQILDQLPVPVVVVDRAGDVSYPNRASNALLGAGDGGDGWSRRP